MKIDVASRARASLESGAPFEVQHAEALASGRPFSIACICDEPCPRCAGSGVEPESVEAAGPPATCGRCAGAGRLRGRQAIVYETQEETAHAAAMTAQTTMRTRPDHSAEIESLKARLAALEARPLRA